MRMIQAIAECEGCGALIGPNQVQRTQRVGNNVFLMFKCSKCEKFDQTHMNLAQYQEYKRVVQQWAENPNVRKRLLSYDPEFVGRTVQGFRIDLDTINTVSDIELEWFDDRRYRVAQR